MAIDKNSIRANREVCNIVIVDYETGRPLLDFEYGNTTGFNITSDSVYAMGHGSKKIAFNNPLEGEFTLTCQCLPFKLYALYSDGKIDTTGSYYKKATVKAAVAEKLVFNFGSGDDKFVAGSVTVYKKGKFGEDESIVAGTYDEATKTFTATTKSDIVADAEYEVGGLISRSTGIQAVKLNDARIPKAVKIYMDTLNKDKDGNMVPYHMTIHKASIQRNLELSYTSDGDPQEITLTFDALTKDKDNFFEMVEIDDLDADGNDTLKVEVANA